MNYIENVVNRKHALMYPECKFIVEGANDLQRLIKRLIQFCTHFFWRCSRDMNLVPIFFSGAAALQKQLYTNPRCEK